MDVGTIVVDKIEEADVLVRAVLVEVEMDGEGEDDTAVAAGTVTGLRQDWLLVPKLGTSIWLGVVDRQALVLREVWYLYLRKVGGGGMMTCSLNLF